MKTIVKELKQITRQVGVLKCSAQFLKKWRSRHEPAYVLWGHVQNYATLPTVLEVAIIEPSGITLARGPAMPESVTKYHVIYPDLEKPLEEASVTGVSAFVETRLNGKATLA